MIPQYSIQEWHEQVPWNTDAMVEQDLIICRALISIFNDEFLAPGPIKPIMFRLGEVLDWLPNRSTAQKKHSNVEKILECYRKYMEFVVGRAPSYKEFVQNMNEKMQDDEFLTDVEPLLRHGVCAEYE